MQALSPVVVFLALFAGAGQGEVSTSSNGPIPEEMKVALIEGGKNLSPLEIHWTRDRSSRFELSELLKLLRLPVDASNILEPVLVQMKMQGEAIYGKYTETALRFGKLGANGQRKRLASVHNVREVSFDGAQLFQGAHKINEPNGHAMLQIWPVNAITSKEPEARFFTADFLEQAGYRIVERADRLGNAPKSIILDLIDNGHEVTKHELVNIGSKTVNSVSLSGDSGTEVFYLDPSLGWAVVRHEIFLRTGELASRANMFDFTKVGDKDIWLPKRIEVSYYAWPSAPGFVSQQPLLDEKYAVSALTQRTIAPEEFSLEHKEAYKEPGTYIADARLPGAAKTSAGVVLYQMPASAEDLDKVVAAAVSGTPESHSSSRVVVIAINIAVVIVLALLVLLRKQSTSKT